MHSEILAIDPGVSGGYAHIGLCPETKTVLLRSVCDMPTYKKKVNRTLKEHLDLPMLAQDLMVRSPPARLAVIEQVGAAPGQGVTSMFRFGYAAGSAAGVCAGLGIDAKMVRPQHWQRWARKRPGKGAAREQVVSLFPDAAHLFKRVKDHNRADAVLIGYAYFCESLQVIPQTKYVAG